MDYHSAFPLKEFQETMRLNPYWSSWTCFCEIIEGKKNLHSRTIRRNFFKLVEKDDYSKTGLKQLLRYLFLLAHDPKRCK